MGRTILIILFSAILTFGIVSIQINRSTSDAGTSTSNYYRDVYAKNIANSMIDVLKIKLLSDTTYRVINQITENVMGGIASYRLIDTFINSAPFVKAEVIARYEGVTKISEAYFSIEKMGSGGLPPFMRYAVLSGRNLNLNGGVTITNAGNGLNANVHVNGNFSMNGNNDIDGFLTYTGSAQSNPANALNTRITPVSNPTNLPVHFQTQQVNIPDIDPNDIKNKATDIYYGNKSFSGNITLGTKENPKIIYVTGDLSISGNVTGYGIFVSLGNVIISGNVTINSPDPTVSNIGIYSKNDLIVNGNVTLNAQLYANGNVVLNGNNRIYGNVVSKNSVQMNGNVTVYYKPANELLAKQAWPVSTSGNIVQVKTLHFYE
ncbi:MAG: hypothetical protein N3F03_03380 [Ignavibacteria bacterium]|nr:hypothetical protein [Ignavibacteria bacterium]